MKRQFLRAACAGTLFAISAFPFCEAAGTKAVTQRNERAAIERELSKSPEFTSAAKGKKVIASTMMTYKEKPNDSATEAEFVESLHYNYDSGKTIRTVLNRTAEKVVKVDLLEAYPTPLAAEEIAAAKQLAHEQSDRIRTLFEKYKPEQLTIQTLAPVVSKRDDPRFRKRLAILIIAPKGKPSETASVTVNLTDKTVAKN